MRWRLAASLAVVTALLVPKTAHASHLRVTDLVCVKRGIGDPCTWFGDAAPEISFHFKLDAVWDGTDPVPPCDITGDLQDSCDTLNTFPAPNPDEWNVFPRYPSGFAQGAFTITVLPGSGGARQLSARVDRTPPPAPAMEAPEGWTSDRRPTVTASASSGIASMVGYALGVDAPAPDSPTHDTSGVIAPAADLADGEHTYHVRGCDERPSCGPESTVVVRVDTVGPDPPPVVSTSHPYGSSRRRDLAFAWSAPPDLSGISGYSWALDQSPSTEPTSTASPATDAAFGPVAPGEWWFHLRAHDLAANAGAVSHLGVEVLEAVDSSPPPRPAPPPAPSHWFLAEGSTGPGFETWVLLANPRPNVAVGHLTYLTPRGPIVGPDVVVQPLTRVSVRVSDTVRENSVSTEVSTEAGPLVVERAVYANTGSLNGAHAAAAVASPSATWAFAEGSTGPGFETYLLLANPQAGDVTATIYFQTSRSGNVVAPLLVLTPRSRTTVRVNDLLLDPEVASLVFATGEIYAERATYIVGKTRPRDATVSSGATASATDWLVAEGAAAEGFETWILVQNPSLRTVEADVAFQTASDVVAPAELAQLVVEPGRRKTIRVNDWVSSEEVATRVHAERGVVVERATYYDRVGLRGATSDVGAAALDTVWYVPEGATAGGFETWLLLANPDPSRPARVQITYMTGSGEVAGPLVTLLPGMRMSIRESDAVGATYLVSAIVSSIDGVSIAVERTTFGASAQGGRGVPAATVLDASGL